MTELRPVSPATDEVLGTFAVADRSEVAARMARARDALPGWSSTALEARLGHIRRLRRRIAGDLDRIVEAIVAATGKPHVEALAGDVLVSLELMLYYERHAAEILAPQPREGHLLSFGSSFHVERGPIGVVAIFSPWNYPLQLSLVPLVSALVAGNTVLLKPSEITPSVGELVAALCREGGLPDGVVQVIQGGPEVGKLLIEAGPDKIFFTGSVETGKQVMRAAADHLIPIELELGGKDPMIVFADANLERAARGATYGAFANAGQACVSVERLYVQREVHDRFVSRLVEEAGRVKVGSGVDADIGPIITPRQREKIDAHVQDALDRGARLALPWRREGQRYFPLVLTNVDHTMRMMREETFGPVLPVMPFDTEEEAVALANDSIYGLNASVWTRDLERGRRVASRIVAGSCAINDVIKNISNPAMPFGGERQSGFGRYHGPEGLHAFSRQRSVMVCSGRLNRELSWFPYSRSVYETVKTLIHALYSDATPVQRARKVLDRILGAIR